MYPVGSCELTERPQLQKFTWDKRKAEEALKRLWLPLTIPNWQTGGAAARSTRRAGRTPNQFFDMMPGVLGRDESLARLNDCSYQNMRCIFLICTKITEGRNRHRNPSRRHNARR